MSTPTCARPGCGKSASTCARPKGSNAAYVPVCSERCGYELIGPKRGADDDAAAKRTAAHQQMLVQRQNDQQRSLDLAEMGSILQDLGRLRARLSSGISPLEVSTATLAIGRRLAADGSDIKRRIDELIADVDATIGRIVRGEPYSLPMVQARLAQLRDDIAADASLDAFDAATGFELRRAGMPDDARQLAAYRANHIQAIASFTVDPPHRLFTISLFFEIDGSTDIVIGKKAYRPDGTEVPATNRPYQPMNEHWGIRLGGGNPYNWDLDERNVSGTWRGVDGYVNGEDITVTIDYRDTLVSRGKHAAIFTTKYAESGIEYQRFNADTASFEHIATLQIDGRHEEYTSFAIDSAGNLWIRASDGLYVFNNMGISLFVDSNGKPIPAIPDRLITMVASSADGCVWVYRTQGDSCTKYRLVPSYEYDRGM